SPPEWRSPNLPARVRDKIDSLDSARSYGRRMWMLISTHPVLQDWKPFAIRRATAGWLAEGWCGAGLVGSYPIRREGNLSLSAQHYDLFRLSRRPGGAKRRPCFHEFAPLLENGTAGICGLDLIAAGMGKSRLGNVILEPSEVAAPILEGRPEAVHGHMTVGHPFQNHEHRHVAQMFVRVERARKQIASTGAVEEPHGAVTERNQVLSLELHVFCWRRPKLLALVDFGRAGKNYFLGARGRQNRKFECARCGAFHLAQLLHERRQLGIGQRRMVFDLPHLRKL